MKQPIDEDVAATMADDWDKTAVFCENHKDRTGAAAFRTCAMQLRQAAGLPEVDIWNPVAPTTEEPRD